MTPSFYSNDNCSSHDSTGCCLLYCGQNAHLFDLLLSAYFLFAIINTSVKLPAQSYITCERSDLNLEASDYNTRL